MFFLESVDAAGQDLVFSASDLVTASQCEYQILRKLDEKLGRSPVFEAPEDAMLERTARLGDLHEHRVLEGFVADFGIWDPATARGVYDVVPATDMDRATLSAKHQESMAALRAGADVVFQAAFFDGQFHGRSDFLVKMPDGSYAVYDTKLARHAKVTALLQLAAYADQLLAEGIQPASDVTLVLGSGEHSSHRLADILPVFRERRARFLALAQAHVDSPEAVVWGDPRYKACGRCPYCAEQVELHRDLLLVAGMGMSRRKKLIESGIQTIDQLAEAEASGDSVFLRLRAQARMQTGVEEPDGTVQAPDKDGGVRTVSYQLREGNTLGRLPEPDAGDIFFDFEGDPLWQDPVTSEWGLEYLFGVIEPPVEDGGQTVFRPFWAHTRSEERRALMDFLAYVADRREKYPNMHIYHYAAYEKTALRHLSLRHTVGEDAVDTLLRDGVLVDLYDTVRHSIRISERSYSIKKLEPLYMGQHLRSGDVTDAGASVVAYADYCTARDTGNPAEAALILESIRDYNEYDCLSTLRLRDWLLELAAKASIGREIEPAVEHRPETEPAKYQAAPEETALLAYVAELPDQEQATPDARAIAMVAASVGYHRREDKQFWWGHFDRLDQPVAEWENTRDCFVVHECEVLQDWALLPGKRNPSRELRLTGHPAEGSGFQAGKTYFRMYDSPVPEAFNGKQLSAAGRSGGWGTEILDAPEDSPETLVVREILPSKAEPFAQLPMALTPDAPVNTKGQRESLSELAHRVRSLLPSWPRDPALDLLRRRPPRLASLPSLPAVKPGPHGYADAITAAVADLDHSYLAVQGPPGTGKTHVGSLVIARLVERGWKVGVIGQSNEMIEHMLCTAIQKAGVDPNIVAKDMKHDGEMPWSRRTKDDVAELLSEPGGCLIGGTAWIMTGAAVPPASLDLLVIDEAGQFSLANTLAVSRCTKRMLLLGDPQQLPQVTTGIHPQPVDRSALGWLSDGHHTLPADLGYFLAESWRMHPDLCAAVSELSYDGRLNSAPITASRKLEGAAAGMECVYVSHTGNSTHSVEEAEEVVRQVRAHLGLPWLDPRNSPDVRPLDEEDILVVAAYNAQVQLILQHLRTAGLKRVRIGTVDKFQGQEAPVVIVSMAASAPKEVPRGMRFLLSRNRINVAISRGQWRAVLVRSPELTNYLPFHPDGLEDLGGFVALCQRQSLVQDRPEVRRIVGKPAQKQS
ncbi:TM0106 family RecB-like putative nuclease [Arthrobacter sp. M4]|uniref:TM0106 family RecB-like putative nuclease n=1 Tax=Arthrobacter sp. M4 TaxID=218160 RepID=UPI001CDB9877|nr:TM0106 family RecB-like putative nuclease [Arthrobacter sp. M4]MCA4133956.1 TM0106 family RecB-like putative nuclease [Arthrobacter sp. M4]